MLYLVIFFIIIFIMIMVLLFAFRLYITIEYIEDGFEGIFTLTFTALWNIIKIKYKAVYFDIEKQGFKLVRIKREKKEKCKKEDPKKKSNIYDAFVRFNAFIHAFKGYYLSIKKIKKRWHNRLKFKRYTLKMTIGTGDAFQTGIAGGMAWSAAGILNSFFSQNFCIENKSVNIKTDFMEKKFNIDLFCIFSIRIVHIIGVVIKAIGNKMKNWLHPKCRDEGGEKNGGTSNRRTDDNSNAEH